MEMISKNLKLIRLILNKTQDDFGKMFNATKSMISSYEKSKAMPDELFIARVCKLAGITETDILTKELKEENLKKLYKNHPKPNDEPAPAAYYPPEPLLIEERALLHLVVAELAKLKAKIYNIPVEVVAAEFAQNAKLSAYHQAEAAKAEINLNFFRFHNIKCFYS